MITNREEVIDKKLWKKKKSISFLYVRTVSYTHLEDELRESEYQHAGESLRGGKDGGSILFSS